MLGWDEYFQHIEFVVGLGNRIRFWQDKWCGDMALMDRFSSLYACSSHREVTIASILMRPAAGGPCEWNVIFGRDFND